MIFVQYYMCFKVPLVFCFRKLSKYFDDDNSNVMRMDEQKGETNKMNDTDDEIIAHTLQNEFNLEYNSMLRNVENKLNRDAKGNNVSIKILHSHKRLF